MTLNEYVIHIKDSGLGSDGTWFTETVQAESFPEAAVLAVTENSKRRGLKLDEIPHRAEHEEHPNNDSIVFDYDVDKGKPYQRVVFYETEPRRIFDPCTLGGWGLSTPGHVWWSVRVREGVPGDCRKCGGTNVRRWKECHMKEKKNA